MQLSEMYNLLYIVIALSVFQLQNDINDVNNLSPNHLLLHYQFSIAS